MKVRRWLFEMAQAVPRRRRWRVVARRVAGGLLIGAGLILMILPGPGIPLVIAGLMLVEPDATRLLEAAFRWIERLTGSVAPGGATTPDDAAARRGVSPPAVGTG